jgi:L-cysteine/cystine lyase
MADRDTSVGGDDGWRLRQFTPVVAANAYLNTGTTGPLLTPVAETMQKAALEELLIGRMTPGGFDAFQQRLKTMRAGLADLLGAHEDEIALTHHTTEGINIVSWGFTWGEGDRVVTTTLEHPGVLLPLYQLHRRLGVEVDFADIGTGEADQTLSAIRSALDRPCKLLVLSHVAWSTGALLPLADIVALAHDAGTPVLVDGAQSVGAVEVDLDTIGADFYAFPGQKWLCGPEGTGGLAVRRSALDQVAQTFVGFLGADHSQYRPNDVDGHVPAAGAARYEVGSLYRPALFGFGSAIEWHRQWSETAATFERIRSLAEYCHRQATQLSDTVVLTPASNMAGLVSVRVKGIDTQKCVAALLEQGVTIRSIPDNGCLRLSCGFFNTREDIDRAFSAIDQFAHQSK